MKEYNIEIQRNMRVTVKVTAESQKQAEKAAMAIAKQKGTSEYRMWGHEINHQWSTGVTAKEAARRKREAVIDFVRHYLHDGCDKEELAAIAFRDMTANWLDYVKVEDEPWRDTLFEAISEGTEPNSWKYNRYMRWAARLRFHQYYGRSKGWERDLTGTSKEQRKQAVLEALTELRRQWQERTGSDEDCRLDYQAILRYNGEDETDYWNVFVYPLVQGGYEYCWQHVMDDGDDMDDYGCIECKSGEELLQRLFYRDGCDTEDDDPDWKSLEHIWVD
jgi:hypothetical protein